jgi:hypothetical protein
MVMTKNNAKNSGDVLSSLKRIVSEDPAAQESATSDVTGKLVLSPAQRLTPKRPVSSPMPTLVLSNSLEAKVSQLEDIISRLDGTWQPDGTEEENEYLGHNSTALDWGRVADAPRDEFDPVLVPSAASLPLQDDEIEHLKEVVAKIVRQEMRGQLGEKITSNLRAMVRREIAMALKESDPK